MHKLESEFAKDSCKESGYQSYCKECACVQSAMCKDRYREQNKAGNTIQKTMKYCAKCEKELPINNFNKDVTAKDGYHNSCKNHKVSYADATIDPNVSTKLCNVCGNEKGEKLLKFFSKCKTGRLGYANICIECRSAQRKKINNIAPTNGVKTCTMCKNTKNVSEFPKDKGASDGLRGECKLCHIIGVKKSSSKLDGFINKIYQDIKSHSKRRQIILEITEKDIKDMYIAQSGKCSVTEIEMTYTTMTERKPDDPHIINSNNISIDRIDSKKGIQKIIYT